MELKENFWKYASTCNKKDTIENIFIEWAGKEKISIDEFNTIYAEVNSEINNMFDKKAFSIKDDTTGQTLTFNNMEEYKQFTESQQPAQPITDINSANPPIDSSMDSSTDIAQQPIENDANVGQDIPQDTSIPTDKSALSPEPNAAIDENIDNSIGNPAEKEIQEYATGLLEGLKPRKKEQV
jgi:hypothetical protein